MSTYYITTNAATGRGSLSYAVANAVNGETIGFSAAVFTGPATDTIDLATTLTITRNITINGQVNGADIVLDGSAIANPGNSGNQTVGSVTAHAAVTLENLVIQSGTGVGVAGATNAVGGTAAGGVVNRGTLTLTGDTFTANDATGGAGGTGVNDSATYGVGATGGYAAGAVLNFGKLTITNTAFTGNTATGGQGGYGALSYGAGAGGGAGGSAAGAIYEAPGASITAGAGNTFAGNSAAGGNGGTGGSGTYFYYSQKYGASGGAGGAGGVNGKGAMGYHGSYDNQTGYAFAFGGRGGNPGVAGYAGTAFSGLANFHGYGAGGGGGGGTGFANANVAGIACYVRGTRIRTVRGPVAVEQLTAGDRVVTVDGTPQPVVWIGRRSYAGRFLQGQHHLMPVRITAGALAHGVPSRDLLVSPCHAMFLDGLLVAAQDLVNGVTIIQDRSPAAVEYYHVELPAHAVIWAEDAASETYLDVGNRAIFQASVGSAAAAAMQSCAERVTSGYELQAIRTKLSRRAA